jgi:hypothetical protein
VCVCVVAALVVAAVVTIGVVAVLPFAVATAALSVMVCCSHCCSGYWNCQCDGCCSTQQWKIQWYCIASAVAAVLFAVWGAVAADALAAVVDTTDVTVYSGNGGCSLVVVATATIGVAAVVPSGVASAVLSMVACCSNCCGVFCCVCCSG